MAQDTPLYNLHETLGAKMVEFHGWNLPLHYGSQILEHQSVRNGVGMFDVSHMTVVDVLGAGARQFLRRLLTQDVDKFTHIGQAQYSCMCNENGGIIDDLIVYQRASDNYRLILNSATRTRCLNWMAQNVKGFSAGLQERNDLGMLAVQGPKSVQALSCLPSHLVDALSTLKKFEGVDVGEWFIARTGYTGEDGFEIILPKDEICDLWSKLNDNGVVPCGLGARDTLRLEAGLLLSGQDFDETTTPLESALAWTVNFDAPQRDFIGYGALISQKQYGVTRKLVGLMLQDKGIMRHGQKVLVPEDGVGIITSGSYSPSLEKSIALARVPKDIGASVLVEIRDKRIPAKVGSIRFVKDGQILW